MTNFESAVKDYWNPWRWLINDRWQELFDSVLTWKEWVAPNDSGEYFVTNKAKQKLYEAFWQVHSELPCPTVWGTTNPGGIFVEQRDTGEFDTNRSVVLTIAPDGAVRFLAFTRGKREWCREW